MTRPVEVVASELLTASPVVPAPIAGPLLRGLDLAPRQVPAWVTDPGMVASILAGHVDIPEDLLLPSLPQIERRLRFAACWALVVLAAYAAHLEAAIAVEEASR